MATDAGWTCSIDSVAGPFALHLIRTLCSLFSTLPWNISLPKPRPRNGLSLKDMFPSSRTSFEKTTSAPSQNANMALSPLLSPGVEWLPSPISTHVNYENHNPELELERLGDLKISRTNSNDEPLTPTSDLEVLQKIHTSSIGMAESSLSNSVVNNSVKLPNFFPVALSYWPN
jgi:hypothetical protein